MEAGPTMKPESLYELVLFKRHYQRGDRRTVDDYASVEEEVEEL